MKVPFYISELLYNNDCVILPGFGGFVTHFVPANIHPVNHTFNPPSKDILFNSKLVRDDGLLIDFIAQKENLTYADAKLKVEDFVENMLKSLNGGEAVIFDNIGSLNRDIQGKILFNPDKSVNYLEESYGLPSFVSPPVIRKPAHRRLETKFIDRKPEVAEKNKRRSVVWIYAAAVPVILFFSWMIFFGDLLPDNTQKSSMVTLPESENEISIKNENPEKIHNPPLNSLDFSDKEVEEANETKDAEPVLQKALPPIKKYYIIGGAFSIEKNADKLVATLRKNGWDANRAGLSPSGFHMVSYMSTGDKNEALVNLGKIRDNENPSAWLLKK